MESIELANLSRELIEGKKGIDIVLLDISNVSSFADYFVNATATNIRQLSTIMDEVEKGLSAAGNAPRGIEGRPESGWVLIDAGDVIVNLFLETERDKYQIEKIWKDAWSENRHDGKTDEI